MPIYPAVVQPPERRRAPFVIAIVFLVVAVLGAGGALAWLLLPNGPAAQPLTARGVVVLGLGQFIWDSNPSPTCSGHERSADLGTGAQVTVTSSTGAVLALGSIGGGTPILSADKKTAEGCRLPFAVDGVPRGRGPYGVQFAARPPIHVNEDGLQTITLSIGV